MNSKTIIQVLKTTLLSTLMMLSIVYGMATGNAWIQYGGIIVIFVGQMLYQGIKTMRSTPLLNANMAEAERVKNGRLMLRMTENDVIKIKREVKDAGDLGMSAKLLPLIVVPLIIFFALHYILGIIAPDILAWQSYAISFLFSMAASTILTVKTGLTQPTSVVVSPNKYYVSEKGIVFDHMNSLILLRYPIRKLSIKREKKFIEVEGQDTKSTIIPYKVRLFSYDVDQLQHILNRFVENPSTA